MSRTPHPLQALTFSALALSTLITLFMQSCSSDDGPDAVDDNPYVPIELSVEEATASENLNGFSLNLLKAAVASNDATENTAVSPLGAAMVAGMVGNAIDRTDRGQLLSTLGVSPMTSLNAYCQKMLSSLPAHDNTAQFVISNATWLNQHKVTIDKTYRDVLTDSYASKIELRNFNDTSTLDEINSWVKEKTAGAMPEIINQISPEEQGIWINALYFKGIWKSPFNKAQTQTKEFTKEDGNIVPVEIMADSKSAFGIRTYELIDKNQKMAKFPDDYKNSFDFTNLDFGNGAFKLTAIMPEEGKTVKQLLASLTEEKLHGIFEEKKEFDYAKVEKLKFPKLNLAISTNLVTPLKFLGLRNVFEGVKMPGIGNDDAKISQFKQEIRLTVDEEGAVIKAATVTQGTMASIVTGEIEFNRPFVYFIWEKSTGAILLAGTVMDPTK